MKGAHAGLLFPFLSDFPKLLKRLLHASPCLAMQADWPSVKGALKGSLALLERDPARGVVPRDSKVVLAIGVLNVHVQALPQHDRMVWGIDEHKWVLYRCCAPCLPCTTEWYGEWRRASLHCLVAL